MKFFIFLLGLFYALIAGANVMDSESYSAIAVRLKPEGTVDIAGQKKIITTAPIDAARPERGGNEIFQQYCIVCHGTGAAGSPKFGCASAWKSHIAKGITVLLHHAKTGFNFMPPKGTCMDCSDGEIEEAVHYIINNSTKDDSSCQKTA